MHCLRTGTTEPRRLHGGGLRPCPRLRHSNKRHRRPTSSFRPVTLFRLHVPAATRHASLRSRSPWRIHAEILGIPAFNIRSNIFRRSFMATAQGMAVRTEALSQDTKKAMMSQFLGFMLDAYDMALVLTMAPILVKFFTSPKGTRPGSTSTIIFAIRSPWRPARRLGHFWTLCRQTGPAMPADLTIGGVGVMSLLAGFLPTYAQMGRRLLRAVLHPPVLMGCFFGGEYAVGHTFAIELAPRYRRGAIGGFVQSGFSLGYVLCSSDRGRHFPLLYQGGHGSIRLAHRLHDRGSSGLPGALFSAQPAGISRIRVRSKREGTLKKHRSLTCSSPRNCGTSCRSLPS